MFAGGPLYTPTHQQPRVFVIRGQRPSYNFKMFLLMLASLGLALWIMTRDPYIFIEKYYDAKHWVAELKSNWRDRVDFEKQKPRATESVARTAPSSRRFIKPNRDPRNFIPYDNGIEQLPQLVGKTATVKAVAFDKADVLTCTHKCSVAFRDHFGRQVKGVFFRQAHGEKLLASYGKVSISGLVKKTPDNDYVIFIEKIL